MSCGSGAAGEQGAVEVDQTVRAAIRDATRGGDPGFHWLPPIVPMATTAGAFDGTQFPSIRVENYSTRVIIDTIPSEEITVLGDRYTWDWDTSQYTINLASTYRLSVIVRNRVIGYTDVRLYTAGSMISPIRNTVQIYDGTTLSVAFHLNQCAPVVCEALDDCHVKGACQPDTGECTNPIGRNGRRCDDQSSCTTGDVCMAGVCAGTTTLPDGAECDDDNACTQTDTCQAGECVGDDEVECEPRDQCHEAGECESTFGLCSEPAAPEGQGCDDGNACTIGDSCEHGSCVPTTLAICYAIDECHLAGSCNPITGCSTPLRPDSTPCNADNDRCTRDRCVAGTCTIGDPVICSAANDCQEAGVCNPANGRCSSASRPDGTTCDDSNGCTSGDFCRNGVCRPGEELECTALDACHRPGHCDRFTGMCDNPFALDGTACSDDDACTLGDECTDGVCQSGVSLTCLASDDCHIAAACDPALGCVDDESPADDGTECDDNNVCTTGEACVAGVCAGGAQVDGCVENEAECQPVLAAEPMPPILPLDPVDTTPLCTAAPGGAIFVGADEVAAYSNCRVQGATSEGNGGGVYVDFGGSLTLTDVLITGNEALGEGGGIFSAGELTLVRVRVTGNVALGSGGGIRIAGFLPGHFLGIGGGAGFLNAVDLRVDNNTSSAEGGGLSAQGDVDIRRALFSSNDATEGGGVWNAGTMFLRDVTIERNAAEDDGKSFRGDGGGIFNSGTLTLEDGLVGGTVAVRGNNADRDGGGVFNQGTLYATRMTVEYNEAGAHGGGAFNQGTLEAAGGAPIRRNSATGASGVLSQRLSIDCLAESAGSGGGIANTGTYVITGGTPILANSASVHGGAIYNEGSLTIIDAAIGESSAGGSGGAIYNEGSLSAYACGFGTCGTTVANSAVGDGGALLNTGYALISDSIVMENTAGGNGGGLTNLIGSLDVVRTTLLANVASLRGGGIANCGGYVGGPSDYLGYAMENVSIVSNTAGLSGGGIDTQAGGFTNSASDPACTLRVCGASAAEVSYIDLWGAPTTYTDCPVAAFTGTAWTTISDNSAPDGPALRSDTVDTSGNGACGFFGPSQTELRTTLIARHSGPSCSGSSESILGVDYNLEDQDSCFLSGPNDVVSTAAGLGNLSGTGLAQPVPLEPGSAAIDRVPCTIGDSNGYGGYGPVATAAGHGRRYGAASGGDATLAPPTDERLMLRPQPVGGYCDVGAYETRDGVSVVSLEVGPSRCGPGIYDERQYTATVHYSDGASADVTDLAEWSGTGNIFFGDPGLAFFNYPGGAYRVTATLGGLSASVDGFAWSGGGSGAGCDDVFANGAFAHDWGDARTQSMVTDLALQPDGKLVAFVQFEEEVTRTTPSVDDQATCAAECTLGTCAALWSCVAGAPVDDFPDEATCLAACTTPGDTCTSRQWQCLTTLASPGSAVVRFNTNGSLDLTWNGSGIVHDPLSSFSSGAGDTPTDLTVDPVVYGGIAVAPNGDVYAATPNLDIFDGGTGSITRSVSDLPWNATHLEVYPASSVHAGKILSFGPSAITRYNVDGTLDLLFGTAGVSDPYPPELTLAAAAGYPEHQRTPGLLLPNGKILVGGATLVGAELQPAFARYNEDGTLDTGYGVYHCAHETGVAGINLRLAHDPASGRVIAAGMAITPLGYVGPVCGNGAVEAGEQCDDGNPFSFDGCSSTCQLEGGVVCGDSQIEGGEECDDGNTTSGDGCSELCQTEVPICGDLVVGPGEGCDDGNLTDGDGCSAACLLESCGNGNIDAGEECDDGNGFQGDGCSHVCHLEVCGNGTLDPGEACDDGGLAHGDGCSSTCLVEVCGNAIIDFGEACDDGNQYAGDGCSACQIEDLSGCGNGSIDPFETCDDANPYEGDGCSPTCQIEVCGNLVIDAGESCDDGDTDGGDGCSETCQIEAIPAVDGPPRFGAPASSALVAGVVVLDQDQLCDASFNGTGVRAEAFVPASPGGDDVAHGASATCDGRIVISGWSVAGTADPDSAWFCPECQFRKYFVMVFSPDGTLDSRFNDASANPGKTRFWIGPYTPSYRERSHALAVDSTRGRIYVGGWVPDIATAYSDGSPASTPAETHTCWLDSDCPSPQVCDGSGFCSGVADEAHRISALQCINLGGGASLPY